MTDLWEIYGRRRKRRKPGGGEREQSRSCGVAVKCVTAAVIGCFHQGKLLYNKKGQNSCISATEAALLFPGHVGYTGNCENGSLKD